MPSSGEHVVPDQIFWIECADCDCSECSSRDQCDTCAHGGAPDMFFACLAEDPLCVNSVCSFAGIADCWVDKQGHAWGWKCGCGRTHQHDTLDGLPLF